MQIFDKRSSGLGPKAMSLLTGVGLGAALMYVLDPERGKGRRSVVRDKAVALANRTGRVVARRSRDLSNRAKGVASEIRSAAGFRDKDGQDEGQPSDTRTIEAKAIDTGASGSSNDRASAAAPATQSGQGHSGQTPQASRPAQPGPKSPKPHSPQSQGGI
jgi:hypothetical protein